MSFVSPGFRGRGRDSDAGSGSRLRPAVRHLRRICKARSDDAQSLRRNEMATRTQRTFATRNDIPEATREKIVELLNARLADSLDLYTQVKQAHWNVKGSDFIQLHELYDSVAES